jgi:hypothetical protein
MHMVLASLTSTDKSVCATLALLFLTILLQTRRTNVAQTLLSVLLEDSAAESIARELQ